MITFKKIMKHYRECHKAVYLDLKRGENSIFSVSKFQMFWWQKWNFLIEFTKVWVFPFRWAMLCKNQIKIENFSTLLKILSLKQTPCISDKKFPQKLTYSNIFLRYRLNFLHCQNLRAFTRTRTRARKTPLNGVILKIHENLPIEKWKNSNQKSYKIKEK